MAVVNYLQPLGEKPEENVRSSLIFFLNKETPESHTGQSTTYRNTDTTERAVIKTQGAEVPAR